MPEQTSNLDSRLKSALLIAIAVFLLAVIVYLGFYYSERIKIKKNVNQQETLLNQTTVIENINTNSPNYIIELPFVYSRSGEVTLVNDPDIYIKARYTLNNQFIEKTLKITTDSSTLFFQYSVEDMIKLAPTADQAKTKITISDIKVGDQITAVSNENIKEANEFTASEIDKQI
jgi:hypothetical protein